MKVVVVRYRVPLRHLRRLGRRRAAQPREVAEGNAVPYHHPDAARAAQKALGAACRDADLGALRGALRGGADPNRVARGWGPVHALIQETVHGEGVEDEPARSACLAALIDAGGDLELRAGFPPAPAALARAKGLGG